MSMAWIEKLKDLPPVLAWRRRRYDRQFVELKAGHLFRGVFDTFEAAAASKPADMKPSYDNAQAAAMYLDRLTAVYPSDYPVMFWLQRLLRDGARNFFEIGGHIGVAYYAYQRYLDYPSDLRWSILDLPAVVEQGQRHAQAHDARRQLSFTLDWPTASSADILLAAGSLQYLPRTLDAMLAELKVLPRHLLLSMTPVHPERSYYTLQNIVTACCAYRIDSHDRLVSSLERLGYRLVDEWQNAEKSCHIAYEPQWSLNYYKGYLFERPRS
jgi:putative methyltransferase (TIGR04325 family)